MDWLSAIGFAPTATPITTIVMRLLVAAILGGVIGFERETTRHRAGLRTHMLIAIAAALYTVLMIEIVQLADGSQSRVDTGRIVEAITAGIAVLGAGGAIFQTRRGVHGLTTGAGMWLAGAVGLACGLGHYSIAVAAVVLAVVVLAALAAVERRTMGDHLEDRRPE
jgi:putative Mg2+ transporter-C (MgtC) family protein